MDEKLKSLFVKVKDHYAKNVIMHQTDEEPKIELTRLEFEDKTKTDPVFMLGYRVTYKNVPVGFTSVETGKEVDVRYDLTFGVFLGLDYALTLPNAYEIVGADIKVLDTLIEKYHVDSDITNDEIKNEMGKQMSLDDYAKEMSYDLVEQFKDEALNIKKSNINFLRFVEV